MNENDWRKFLDGWSKDLRTALGKPGADDESLGTDGASPDEIRALEQKLGVTLPPSYRAFLSVSNGFAQPGHLIPRLLETSQVDWLKNFPDHGIDEWIAAEKHYGEPPPIPDAEYFVYGPGQRTEQLRSEYLWQAVQVSDLELGGTAVYLLNSAVQFPNGEWEAWLWAHWLPGAQRYRSFWDLMLAERQSFLETTSP